MIKLKKLLNKIILSENSIDLRMSVLGLIKNNNGIFKSEKQAAFLKSIIDQNDGLVGHTEHGRPYFAYHDDKGITKVEVGNPPELYWERKEAGILRPADLKTIKSLQRQIKQLESDVAEREEELRAGTYTDRFGVIAQKKEEIARKKERINQIQTS
jgi:hypothetical protein